MSVSRQQSEIGSLKLFRKQTFPDQSQESNDYFLNTEVNEFLKDSDDGKSGQKSSTKKTRGSPTLINQDESNEPYMTREYAVENCKIVTCTELMDIVTSI